MDEFDRLPPDLRAWVAGAALPWSARSVKRAFDRAKSRTGCAVKALQELDRIQASLVAKDARRVWDGVHPEAVGR